MTVLVLLRGEIRSKRTVAYARKFAVPRVCLDRRLNFVMIVPMNVRYRVWCGEAMSSFKKCWPVCKLVCCFFGYFRVFDDVAGDHHNPFQNFPPILFVPKEKFKVH